ncbi:hypothetical protein [Marivivens donghaensis]|nr:hypothetical protein [Marivivens donghaensis]
MDNIRIGIRGDIGAPLEALDAIGAIGPYIGALVTHRYWRR